MSVSVKEIDEFWQWLAGQLLQFGLDYTEPMFISELDHRISRLFPDGSWEIGPDCLFPGETFLAISPCRSREYQVHINAAIRRAPPIRGWHFYSSKPRKKWNREFVLHTSEDARIVVDGNKCFINVKHDGAGITVLVLFEQAALTEKLLQQGADLLVESEIGEQCMIDLDIDVLGTTVRGTKNDWRPISDLLAALGYNSIV